MRIVVGVDASEQAEVVVEKAIDLAQAFGAELHAVHVFQPPFVYDLGAAIDVPMIEEAESGAVWNRVGPLLDEATGIEVERVRLTGGPAQMLVRYAEEHDADLIVVGNRGRGDFASLVLGSTSHGVIHSAGCDVVVVKTG